MKIGQILSLLALDSFDRSSDQRSFVAVLCGTGSETTDDSSHALSDKCMTGLEKSLKYLFRR